MSASKLTGIRSTSKPDLSYWVLGGDDNGAMYGGLQIAENIQFNGMAEAFNEDDAPHLKNRGIKFNVPLDKEAPTYFYDVTRYGQSPRHPACVGYHVLEDLVR